jgi:hypothetical protein
MTTNPTTVGELFQPIRSPRQWALITAIQHLGGGGKESDIQENAGHNLPPGERVHGRPGHEKHDYFSASMDALIERGIVRKVVEGRTTEFWFTQDAWAGLGNSGPVPTPAQGGLF